ncbi:hypothetical protein QYE76_000637 [Lolium multiflorum]|uniref:TF-B3 domain-containing protein n=1 Tax=Lolium multiflorum TaxID=4521 RepID=A0AAD8RLH4_LOLMU|nr:hypothetical protein QYE76_000637 [Lolium multiflorum]
MGASGGQEAEIAADRTGAGRRGGGPGEELWVLVLVEVDEEAGEHEREQVGAQEAAAIHGVPPGPAHAAGGCEPARRHAAEQAASTSSGRCAAWPSSSMPSPRGAVHVRGKMYLHIGWKKFACYHHLEAGFVVVFSYLGEGNMSVKVFDETRCRRHYHGNNVEEDGD